LGQVKLALLAKRREGLVGTDLGGLVGTDEAQRCFGGLVGSIRLTINALWV